VRSAARLGLFSTGTPALPRVEVHTRPRHACMPAAPRTTGQSVDKLLAFRTVHAAHALLRVVHLSRKSGAWYPGKRITARQMPSCDLTWSTAARPPQPVENVSAIAEGGEKRRWRTPEIFSPCSQAKGQHRQPRTHLPGRPACAPRRGWVSLPREHQHYLEWSTRGHGTPAGPPLCAPRLKALTNFCHFTQLMRFMHSYESPTYRESRGGW
jgi:hypothetical protein